MATDRGYHSFYKRCQNKPGDYCKRGLNKHEAKTIFLYLKHITFQQSLTLKPTENGRGAIWNQKAKQITIP